MIVKKETDEITDEICLAKDKIENILKSYLNEYADYGWDSLANELTGIIAQLEAVNIELKYATVNEERPINF